MGRTTRPPVVLVDLNKPLVDDLANLAIHKSAFNWSRVRYSNRLAMLLAVLHKHAVVFNADQSDVYLRHVSGGVVWDEPALILAPTCGCCFLAFRIPEF